jgi:hypothetical protein
MPLGGQRIAHVAPKGRGRVRNLGGELLVARERFSRR